MSSFGPDGLTVPSVTTTERTAISSPETGRFHYNSTTKRYEVYTGTFWAEVDLPNE